MKAQILRIAGNLRESYWFLPSVMTAASLVLALLMVFIDSRVGSEWMDGVPWLYAARPDGARSLLSALGGSMIGVAGTTFSVTIAAVVYASGQYGPRLLSNFMADRGNQVTLGTFIATFVYALVVLRTIRSPGESGAGAAAFVPQLALIVAMLLAIASIAVLIFFIHHVPRRIHINSVIEEIGDRLLREIDNRFPTFIGSGLEAAGPPGDASVPPLCESKGSASEDISACVTASGPGYVQVIDDDAIMAVAKAADIVLCLHRQPGDFVRKGSVLASVRSSRELKEEAVAKLRESFALGSRRTPLQDLRFLIDELVEIAARALSPGVNDPFTAATCLDWIGAAFADLAGRSLPSPLRSDDAGELRVIACPQSFETLVERGFGALTQYASADRIAGVRFLHAIEDVALACTERRRLAILRAQGEALSEMAGSKLDGAAARAVREQADKLFATLDRCLNG